MKYQKSSHVTYDNRYHLVWITKYRKEILTKEIQEKLREILETSCEKIWVKILKLWFEKDHVHMYIRIPLTKSVSQVVWYIKWKSSYILQKLYYSYFKKIYWWTDAIWAVWYFVATVWETNWETIAKYVEQQGKEENEVIEIEL